MSDQPNKPLLSDEEIREIRSHHDHALSIKQSAYQVRDIYEAERAKDRELIQKLADAIDWLQSYDNGCPLPTWKKGYNTAHEKANEALKIAADRGYTPCDE